MEKNEIKLNLKKDKDKSPNILIKNESKEKLE